MSKKDDIEIVKEEVATLKEKVEKANTIEPVEKKLKIVYDKNGKVIKSGF